MEFQRGRVIGLGEEGLSYRAIAARVQRNSPTVMRVWKQWTDVHRTSQKTSARDVQHLLCMTVNDRTTSSRQLGAHWLTATDELMSISRTYIS